MRRPWLATIGVFGTFVSVACGTSRDDATASAESALTSGVLTVTATATSTWNTGYCENVVVANGGTAATTSWTVTLSIGSASLSNGWSGTFGSSGGTLTVTPLSWNAAIGPGQSTSFGFCATSAGAPPPATVVSASASGGGSATGSTTSTTTTSRSTSSSATSASSSRSTTSSVVTSSTTSRATVTSTTTTTATSTTATSSSSASSAGNGSTCTWAGGPSSSSGELTCFWFGQGTATGGGCPGFKTFCGYCGTESGSNDGGVCPTAISDSVPNTATPFFAAFPVGTFGQGTFCGMCVDISYKGKSIIATVVDECATCPTNNHLDLGLSAALALGLGQNGATGDATSGVTWQAVDCPVPGNIVAEFNNGFAGQIYFQNVTFPVKSATAGWRAATQRSGFWDFGGSVAGQSVTLTDGVGHTVTGVIPGQSGGSIGVQFPATCQ